MGERGARERDRGVCETYHIDQYIKWSTIPFLNQLGGVVISPLGLVVQVSGEGLLAPGAFAWVGDRGVGGDGFVFPWVLEELNFVQQRPPQLPWLQEAVAIGFL